MKVLIACERSGIVRDAFRALGHDAISCDLFPTERPGPHHTGDVRPLLRERWDLVIAHPVCRYLTNAGAKHLYAGGRRYNPDGSESRMCPDRVKGAAEGAAFFNDCLNANADMVAVENPVMHWLAKSLTRSGDITQTVQPWWFGDETFKATAFRLRGLPPLVATDKLTPPQGWHGRAQGLVVGSPDVTGARPGKAQKRNPARHCPSAGTAMGRGYQNSGACSMKMKIALVVVGALFLSGVRFPASEIIAGEFFTGVMEFSFIRERAA